MTDKKPLKPVSVGQALKDAMGSGATEQVLYESSNYFMIGMEHDTKLSVGVGLQSNGEISVEDQEKLDELLREFEEVLLNAGFLLNEPAKLVDPRVKKVLSSSPELDPERGLDPK